MLKRDEPFRSKAERAGERALEAHYHQLGNSAVIAALQQQRRSLMASQDRKPATAARQN